MARNVTEISKKSSEDIADQLATLRSDVSELTSLIGEISKTKTAEVADAVKTKATAATAAAKDQAATANKQAHEFVQNQPAAALGIAAGIGFLVGFMGSRK